MIDAAADSALAASPVLRDHRAAKARRRLVVIGLALACVVAFALDLATGPSSLPMDRVLRGLFEPSVLSPAESAIVWQIRLPYALMAALVGVALALSGAEMQTVLNNPLASPFTLGVSSAASFGASLAIVFGVGLAAAPQGLLTTLNAFVFALGSVLLLQVLARAQRGGVQSIVLFGIALVFAFNAATALVQFVSSPEALQQLVFWTMGSLSRATWNAVAIMGAVVLLVTPFSLLAARSLTALRLGEDRAMSFGVDAGRLRFMSLLRASLLSAAAVAFVGVVGFIGLVAPHIARLLVGEDHRIFLPASLLSGALLMSLASTASKTLVPGALLPVGIVTAVIGVPVFLVLILRNARG
ncbi:FecCD family ABC transporter permease [Phenylobacterium sp.]|uniref:FecCD family ABC transporter permease n=1 Tax=Phenylobacterium sp. TaxID=1871053 RepID=UPI003784BA67